MTLKSIRKYFACYTAHEAYPLISEMLLDIQDEVDSSYMELPVDADGVPIRIGDSLECTEYGNQTERFTVHGYTTEYPTWTGDAAPLMATDENSTEFYCRNCRHVNPRTLTDVLCDLFEHKMTVTDAEHELCELLGGDAE